MRVIFLGVGEAFDQNIPNNSHLVLSKTKLLLDCGYSAPPQLWKYNSDQSLLDAIYITHRHADHYFGIPALLVRMWEEGRTKPLTIICQKGLKKVIQDLIELGYQGVKEKFDFELKFIEVNSGDMIQVNELTLSFAPSTHSASNFAVKIDDGKNTLCYSGDGDFNQKTKKLYEGCDLLIHEAYLFDENKIGHTNVKDLVDMASILNIKCLALTHLQREFREEKLEILREYCSKQKLKIIIPECLEEFVF